MIPRVVFAALAAATLAGCSALGPLADAVGAFGAGDVPAGLDSSLAAVMAACADLEVAEATGLADAVLGSGSADTLAEARAWRGSFCAIAAVGGPILDAIVP